MERPSVSVVVPFAGSEQELQTLRARLETLSRRPGDELIVAANRPLASGTSEHAVVQVCQARGIRTPGFARNCAVRSATGDWLVFIDADTEPARSLLDAYFDPLPDARTAVLAGAVADRAGRDTLVARHSVARAQMSQQNTLTRAGSPYAQTVNCAILRSAFEAVGGFDEQARAGEDADLCFRLARAGWGIEDRPGAQVIHQSRETIGAWVSQLARHGSGAAWVNRRWPGEFPPPAPRKLAARLARSGVEAVGAAARGDRERAAFALLDLAGACAFELGRLLPNHPSGDGPARVGAALSGNDRR